MPFISDVRHSQDGSIKFVVESVRGPVEVLYFEYAGHFDGVAARRSTLCLSVQSGCPLNCSFCSTALLKFGGSLSGKEITDEAEVVQQHLAEHGQDPASSYALMGMGEPLLNFSGIVDFYRITCSTRPEVRPISLSTVGIPNQIRKLTELADVDYKMFISIHSPFQAQRDQLMPDLKKFPLTESLAAAGEYAASRERKVEASYLLLAGVNDSPEHIHAAAALLDPDLFDAQVLLFNEGNGIGFRRPGDDVAERAADIFRAHGLLTTVQVSKGRDINGGCGQLAVARGAADARASKVALRVRGDAPSRPD